MIRQYELVETVKSYDPTTDESAVDRAYVYAMKMHGSQTRASGDPYFSHTLEVAGILTGLKLDHGTIIISVVETLWPGLSPVILGNIAIWEALSGKLNGAAGSNQQKCNC